MGNGYQGHTLPGCPCRGCGARHEACHGACEKYRAWSAANTAARERQTENRVLDGYAAAACERVRKGTHQAFVRRRSR